MTPPGRVVLGIRRAFYANSGRELTTRELWSWTHPREVHCLDVSDARTSAGRSVVPPSGCASRSRAAPQSWLLQLIIPSTLPTELKTTLTPHSIIHGDACFAYFNKIWGTLVLNARSVSHQPTGFGKLAHPTDRGQCGDQFAAQWRHHYVRRA
jgi:hypothetical protein